MSYIEDSIHAKDLGSLESVDQWNDDHLRPGDLIFCRQEKALTTLLIEQLDGFFTHVGVYVGNGRMVHSFAEGVVEWELTPEFVGHYSCLAIARPNVRSEVTRAKVATWARDQVHSGPAKIPFGAVDLGQACALLARGRMLLWRRLLPKPTAADIDGAIEKAQELIELSEVNNEEVRSTCAGFSWRSWESAEAPITPRLARGLLISQGLLRTWDNEDPSVLEWLLDGAETESSSSGLPLLDKKELERYKAFAQLAVKALPGLGRMLNPGKAVPLHEAVAPGDLWCSPSMGERFFLTAAHRDRALDN